MISFQEDKPWNMGAIDPFELLASWFWEISHDRLQHKKSRRENDESNRHSSGHIFRVL